MQEREQCNHGVQGEGSGRTGMGEVLVGTSLKRVPLVWAPFITIGRVMRFYTRGRESEGLRKGKPSTSGRGVGRGHLRSGGRGIERPDWKIVTGIQKGCC